MQWKNATTGGILLVVGYLRFPTCSQLSNFLHHILSVDWWFTGNLRESIEPGARLKMQWSNPCFDRYHLRSTHSLDRLDSGPCWRGSICSELTRPHSGILPRGFPPAIISPVSSAFSIEPVVGTGVSSLVFNSSVTEGLRRLTSRCIRHGVRPLEGLEQLDNKSIWHYLNSLL